MNQALPHIEAPVSGARKPRLLWANCYCLLDTSSGASIAIRQMLLQLVAQGYEVAVLGATVFDNPKGVSRLEPQWDEMLKNKASKPVVEIRDGPLRHKLLVTRSTTRELMQCQEEALWFKLYMAGLAQFKPDLVFYFGGKPLDYLIADEASARRIPSVFYLANGNYMGDRWSRDVDLILTDSQATAGFYGQKRGYKIVPVGAFIDPATVVAREHSRKNILFVNPSPEKGAGVVAQLALLLEARRPDIQFEVVESRGDWSAVVKTVSQKTGLAREALSNVVVTPNTADMRPIYGRARLLLAPSLWWESAGRVLAEAMLNGIPALVTDRGGMPEMIGDAGIKIQMPEKCYEAPYSNLPNTELLEPLIDRIIRFYDDPGHYDAYVERAFKVARTRHSLSASTRKLVQALEPFASQRAGDLDSDALARRRHKHGRDPSP